MLNIHAISYHNIGPFADKKLSVFFRGGKYLIKAPIGSGKSFLFFDGPLYGLYKYASRRMINIHHKNGYIKILFSIHDTYYLIVRSLTQGKSKESCTSAQYIVHQTDGFDGVFADYDILHHNVDIEQVLQNNNISLEPVVFKNETDLQQTLDTLLPPKDVFTSTMFLLQDSSNIFELTPSERIEILKNVFDLLSIDTAKDRIADKRREVQLQKKILADTQAQDAKLRATLTQFVQQFNQLLEYPQWQDLKSHQSTIQERSVLTDKITLQECSIPQQSQFIVDDIHRIFKQQQEIYHNYTHKKEALESSIQKQQTKIQHINQEIEQYHNQKNQIEQQIIHAEIPDINAIKAQINAIQSQQEQAMASINQAAYQSIIATLKLESVAHTNPLQFAYQTIQACIQQGKLLAQEKTTLEQQQHTLQTRKQEYEKQLNDLDINPGTVTYMQLQQAIASEQENKNKELAAISREEALLEKQVADHQFRIVQIANRIKDLSTNNPDIAACVQEIQDAVQTKDTAIITNITHIITKYLGDKQLNILNQELQQAQKQLEQLDHANKQAAYIQQKQSIQQTLDTLYKKPEYVLGDFFAQIEQKREQIQSQLDVLDYEHISKHLQSSIKHIDTQTQTIRDFLQENRRKDIEILYQQYQSGEQEKQTLYKQLDIIDSQLKAQQEYAQQIHTLATQIQQRQQDIQTIQQEIGQEQKELNTFLKEHDGIHADTLQQYELIVKQIDNYTNTISDLVRDHTGNQQKLAALTQEEKVLNNLYQIVSKELLLLVLGESLTFLTDIINVYLAQIFSLQLHMEIQKTSSDKVELAAYCEDEKGKREVKSLSGGQKTILKLVWMLAIASYLRAPMLFLDETINNIDTDTVSKVADMLTDFVKKHDMKLYTITHSEQIQSMNIWDSTIHIG